MNIKDIRKEVMDLFNSRVALLPKPQYLLLLEDLHADFACMIDCVKEEMSE